MNLNFRFFIKKKKERKNGKRDLSKIYDRQTLQYLTKGIHQNGKMHPLAGRQQSYGAVQVVAMEIVTKF